MANEELSGTSTGDEGRGLRKRLDEAVVLSETVFQLRKDLSEDDVAIPEVGERAFEELRQQVLAILAAKQRTGSGAFGRAINRVDLTEAATNRAMAAGGLPELASQVVLRCLQKVLTRKRFAGLG
jgi:hypothetical protein